jgi:hypothetical protein
MNEQVVHYVEPRQTWGMSLCGVQTISDEQRTDQSPQVTCRRCRRTTFFRMNADLRL